MEPHVCNYFDPLTDTNNIDDDVEARSIFFTDRYQAHEDAQDVAQQRAKFVQDHTVAIQDGLWYAPATNIDLYLRTFPFLVQARSFLKFSYVKAFANDKGSRKQEDSFQAQQAILELSTEKLTQLCMTSIDQLYSTGFTHSESSVSLEFMFQSMRFHSAVLQECMNRLQEF
jgi:hypothetical protein